MSQNTFDINNRNVVITGGSTGIGFALAKALGAKGCKLLVAEPEEERLKTAVLHRFSQFGVEWIE